MKTSKAILLGILSLVLAFCLAGCSSQKLVPVDPNGVLSLTKDGTKFSANLIVSKDRLLRFSYSVTNLESMPLILFNYVYHYADNNEGFEGSKDMVYVQVHGETTVISKRVFDVPELMALEVPHKWCGVAVMPGETYEEEVEVNLPLSENLPFASSKYLAKMVTTDKLKLELGYFRAKPGTMNVLEHFVGKKDKIHCAHIFYEKNQSIVDFGPWPVVAEVKKLQD